MELLAAVDEAHDTLNGAATKKVMEREFSEYGKAEYERISKLSVAHIYRLRGSRTCRNRRVNFTKTKPTVVMIGERRCPQPQGRPGFLRVDTTSAWPVACAFSLLFHADISAVMRIGLNRVSSDAYRKLCSRPSTSPFQTVEISVHLAVSPLPKRESVRKYCKKFETKPTQPSLLLQTTIAGGSKCLR